MNHRKNSLGMDTALAKYSRQLESVLYGESRSIPHNTAVFQIEKMSYLDELFVIEGAWTEKTYTDTQRIKYGIMAKTTERTKNDKWQGFASVELTDADEQGISDYANSAHAYEVLKELVQDGYKVTVSFQEQSQGFVAAATGQAMSDNPSQTLTGWSGTIDDAIYVLGYKHYIVCRGNWPKPDQPQAPKRKFR